MKKKNNSKLLLLGLVIGLLVLSLFFLNMALSKPSYKVNNIGITEGRVSVFVEAGDKVPRDSSIVSNTGKVIMNVRP